MPFIPSDRLDRGEVFEIFKVPILDPRKVIMGSHVVRTAAGLSCFVRLDTTETKPEPETTLHRGTNPHGIGEVGVINSGLVSL